MEVALLSAGAASEVLLTGAWVLVVPALAAEATGAAFGSSLGVSTFAGVLGVEEVLALVTLG